MKYNKNETCGNLLLNKNLKGKACRSYDGEVIPFLKLPPQNSCVTSKAKGPLHKWSVVYTNKYPEYPITLQFMKITNINQLDKPLQKRHDTALAFVCSHSCSCITNFSHLYFAIISNDNN